MRLLDETAPPERLAVLRILTGLFAVVYLAIRWGHLRSVARFAEHRFDPVGPLGWLDGPVPAPAADVLVLAALAAGVAYLLGWHHRLLGPVFAVLLLAVLTYRNSWGQIDHTENLLVLHVAIVALAPAADALSLDARRRPPAAAGASVRYGFPMRLAAIVTVLTYFVAGVAKLRYGGLDWVTGDVLLHQVAFDNARKIVLGDVSSPIAGTVLAWPWVFRPMALASVVVEVGAPLALLGGWWARGWAGAAWLFHLGVLALMAILFPYPLAGVAFAPLFPLERLVDRLPAWGRRPAPTIAP